MKKFVLRFWRDEKGQDLVEYALLLSLLAIAGVAGLSALATTLQGVWTNTNTALQGGS
jgi:pilus assembly protein Flp/PilA